MVKNQLSLILAGRVGGCVSVNCAVTFFLMLRQNYEVILVSVLLSHDHKRLHLMVVLCETSYPEVNHDPTVSTASTCLTPPGPGLTGRPVPAYQGMLSSFSVPCGLKNTGY